VGPARLVGGLQHLLGLLLVQGHRLLAQHVLAGREGGQCLLMVQHGRRADRHQVEIIAADELAPVCGRLGDA